MQYKTNRNEQYYDNYLLANIMKWFKYEPFSTMDNLEQYIEKYPLDVVAYTYYSQILIDMNDFESAQKLLDYIDETFPTEKDERVLFNRFRILCLSEDYEKAKQFYEEHKHGLLAIDSRTDFFETIYKIRHGSDLKRSGFNRYLQNQLIDYQEDSFIDHIKKHLADYNMDLEEPNPAVFNSDFPLDKVLNELKTLIPNETRTNFSFYNNFYVFKYDNVGKVDRKTVNYFRVVVINGTNKIVTMYPLEHGENLPYVDLNYLNTMYQKPKERTLSRVDRFYQKYHSFYK